MLIPESKSRSGYIPHSSGDLLRGPKVSPSDTALPQAQILYHSSIEPLLKSNRQIGTGSTLQEEAAFVALSEMLDQDGVSEVMEVTTIDETFELHFGANEYNMTSEQCAKVLRLTLARLENLRTSLRVAIEEEVSIDCRREVAELLRVVEKRMKQ